MPDTPNKVPDVAAPAPAAAPEVAVKPDTPSEAQKKRLTRALKETDDERSERRAGELKTHFDAHMENIKGIHAAYPASFFTKGSYDELLLNEKAFKDAVEADNARRVQIDSANKAYHRAVRATFADHQAEDHHIRSEQAKAARPAA